jgi:hypothetical protein
LIALRPGTASCAAAGPTSSSVTIADINSRKIAAITPQLVLCGGL